MLGLFFAQAAEGSIFIAPHLLWSEIRLPVNSPATKPYRRNTHLFRQPRPKYTANGGETPLQWRFALPLDPALAY